MSPEKYFRLNQKYGFWVDDWAFGIIMLEVLSSCYPFFRNNLLFYTEEPGKKIRATRDFQPWFIIFLACVAPRSKVLKLMEEGGYELKLPVFYDEEYIDFKKFFIR